MLMGWRSPTHQHLLNRGLYTHYLYGIYPPRTDNTHQWLPLQFVTNYSWRWTRTASETCRVVKNKPNKQNKLHLVSIFYKTNNTNKLCVLSVSSVRCLTVRSFTLIITLCFRVVILIYAISPSLLACRGSDRRQAGREQCRKQTLVFPVDLC